MSGEPKSLLWTIRGEAYDLSGWQDEHPGGAYVLERTRGSDVTALFESYHTFAEPARLVVTLARFRVRAASSAESQASCEWEWGAQPKTTEARRRVRAYFSARSPKAPRWVLAYYCAWAAALAGSLCAWQSRGGGAAAAALLGLAIWYCAGDMCHSGLHYAVLARPRDNLRLGFALGWLHMIPALWFRQHVIGHHAYPNVEGRDPDLYHFQATALETHGALGWRLCEDSSWARRWRYGVALVAAMTGLGPLLLESIEYIAAGRYLSPYVVAPCAGALPARQRLEALAYWLAVAALIVRAAALHGPLIAVLPFATHGSLYYLFSQVSHANHASHLTPEPAGVSAVAGRALRVQQEPRGNFPKRKGEWLEHQFATSQGDYAYESRFWNMCSNGLNLQSVHHCFPNVHWAHYPELYRILCDVLGQQPTQLTFWASLRNHARFLASMNDGPHFTSAAKLD